jgi:hypothetical protein
MPDDDKADDKKPADDKAKQPAGIPEDEVQRRIDAARAEERQKLEEAKAKEKEEAERLEAEKRGEFEKLAAKEAEKREQAERERDEAKRVAQVACVQVQLRDHLADKHPEYMSNAGDVMNEVAKRLTDDAKPEAVAKLIEEQAKAFVERTPRQKPTGGTPSSPGKNQRAPEGLPPKPKPEARQRRMWAQQNYRG